MIVGIDEVGRGPWAGPLVVGAVVLGDATIEGLTDSKKLTKRRREELSEQIYGLAASTGLGWVHADELDELGISTALVEATKRALTEINVPYHEIIIDGTVNFLKGTGKGPYVTTLKKADLLIPSVSAASIIAKVARDRYMEQQHELYPDYGFASHVGYGTAAHRLAIERHGVTSLHRLSFAPLAVYRGEKSTRSDLVARSDLVKRMPTRLIGDKGEEVAAKYLRKNGHKMLEQNWRTKYCEIDIVSTKDGVFYFTEVKHRKNDITGGGIAAITPKKMKQMNFAARLYATTHKLNDVDLRLAAIATVGEPPKVIEFIEID